MKIILYMIILSILAAGNIWAEQTGFIKIPRSKGEMAVFESKKKEFEKERNKNADFQNYRTTSKKIELDGLESDKFSDKSQQDMLEIDLEKEGFVKDPKIELQDVVVNQDSIKISIADHMISDSDKIDLYIDEELILKDFKITKSKHTLPIKLSKQITKITLVAKTTGWLPMNTASIHVTDTIQGKPTQNWQLGLNQFESFKIILRR